MKNIWNLVAEKYKKMKKSAKAFVIFMVAMVLLTIFNANIQQFLLPYVKVENPKSGNIFIKVRGNGLLEAGETINVSSKEEKQIKEIHVNVGDVVKKGETLITCESIQDGSLELEQMELAELEDEYEKTMLELSSEYGVDHLIISDAREQLLLAMERLDAVEKNYAAYETADAEIQKEKEELKTLQKDLEKAKTKLGEKQLSDTKELEKEIKQFEKELEKESLTAEEEAKLTEELNKKREQLLKKQEKNGKIQTQTDRVNELQNSCKEKEERIQGLLEQQEIRMSEGIDVDEARLDVNQKQITLRQYLLDEKKDSVDFDTLVKKIDDKREEIAKQSDEKENQLVADTDGVIREILCQHGDVVQRNQTLVAMSPLDTKYKFSFEINKNLVDYVSVGDEAKVLNVWDEEISCKLMNIKASSEAVDKCLVLEFSAEGENLAIGQNIAVSVGETKQYYDLIIPQTALNEDNEGSFVYVLRTQHSGFTVRYYVERMDVQVLGSDETQVAVSGALSEDDYIVTQSMEPLENFEKVRLVD